MNLHDATRPLTHLGLEILQGFHVSLDYKWNHKNVCDPFTRLYYVSSGGGVLREREKEIPLQPGHVYMIPAGCTFSYACHDTLEKIYFHIRIKGGLWYDLLSTVQGICSMSFSPAEFTELKQFFYSSDYAALFQVHVVISETIKKLTGGGEFWFAPVKRYSPLIEKTLSFIEEDVRITLSIGEISKALFVAPSTLRNKFKEETGISLGQYIDNLVLTEAKTMLMDPKHSIQSAADFLGFCDRFYFSRRFKEKYGITPAAYRRSILPE